MIDNEFYIGDDVRTIRNPETKGIVHHLDGEYVWVRIGEELIPMLSHEIEIDKSNETGYFFGCLSAFGMIALILWVIYHAV